MILKYLRDLLAFHFSVNNTESEGSHDIFCK